MGKKIARVNGGLEAATGAAEVASDLAARTNSIQDVDAAIEAWRRIAEALHADTEVELVLRVFTAIGALQWKRWQSTGHLGDCDAAIDSLERGLAEAEGHHYGGARANLAATLLAEGLMGRFDTVGEPADLTRALDLLGPLLDDGSEHFAPKAVVLAYARALGYRYARAGNLDDLEHQISILGRNAILNENAEADVERLQALGNALAERYGISGDRRDLDGSIQALEQALAAMDSTDRRSRAALLSSLGASLRHRQAYDSESDDLDRAIRCHQDAVALAPMVWGFHNNLAVTYMQRARARDSREDLDRAIAGFRRARDHTAETSPDMPGYLTSFAAALEARSYMDRSEADFYEAVEMYQQACVLGLENNVDLAFDGALEWALSALSRESWLEASAAFEYGLSARDRLLQEQPARRGKEQRLLRAQDLPPRAAYVMAKAGMLERAVLTIERGRGLLMADKLQRDGQPSRVSRYRMTLRLCRHNARLSIWSPPNRAVSH